jgi:hypothetical protein
MLGGLASARGGAEERRSTAEPIDMIGVGAMTAGVAGTSMGG